MKKKDTKNTKHEGRGGARPGAGRKSADILGVEKKQRYVSYMYPTHYQELLKYFPTISDACEWAVENKKQQLTAQQRLQ